MKKVTRTEAVLTANQAILYKSLKRKDSKLRMDRIKTEVLPGLTVFQIGGVISSLVEKGLVTYSDKILMKIN
jgi:hypothetical protein